MEQLEPPLPVVDTCLDALLTFVLHIFSKDGSKRRTHHIASKTSAFRSHRTHRCEGVFTYVRDGMRHAHVVPIERQHCWNADTYLLGISAYFSIISTEPLRRHSKECWTIVYVWHHLNVVCTDLIAG